MAMRARLWAMLLAATTATLPVVAPALAAGQRPPVLPLRDVAVEYRVSGHGFQDIRSVATRYSVAAQRLRVETDDRAMGYLLVDPRTRMARMVVPGLNQYVELTLAKDRRAALLFNDKLGFTRRGAARIAGLPCTLWDVRGGKDTARACITDDGVILRAEGTGGDAAGNTLEATRVDYTPQSGAMFQLPNGSGQLNLQSLLRGLGRAQ
jgi:hypothetical protein